MTKMKASELRIGNWINIIGLVPTQVVPEHIKFISEGDDQYDPIPLNEQWLLKFGFDDKTETWYTAKYFEYKGLNLIKWGVWMDDVALYRNDTYMAKVEHVHTLQNLYFALTNTELTIKD